MHLSRLKHFINIVIEYFNDIFILKNIRTIKEMQRKKNLFFFFIIQYIIIIMRNESFLVRRNDVRPKTEVKITCYLKTGLAYIC